MILHKFSLSSCRTINHIKSRFNDPNNHNHHQSLNLSQSFSLTQLDDSLNDDENNLFAITVAENKNVFIKEASSFLILDTQINLHRKKRRDKVLSIKTKL